MPDDPAEGVGGQQHGSARPLLELIETRDARRPKLGDSLRQPQSGRAEVLHLQARADIGRQDDRHLVAELLDDGRSQLPVPGEYDLRLIPLGQQPDCQADRFDQAQDGITGSAVGAADDQDQVGASRQDAVDPLLLAVPVGQADLLDHVQVGGFGQPAAAGERHARHQPDQDSADAWPGRRGGHEGIDAGTVAGGRQNERIRLVHQCAAGDRLDLLQGHAHAFAGIQQRCTGSRLRPACCNKPVLAVDDVEQAGPCVDAADVDGQQRFGIRKGGDVAHRGPSKLKATSRMN